MSSVISKWIVPGVVTVLTGTVGTILFSQGTIEEDLTQKSLAAISVSGDHTASEWAEVSFDGRDGQISGITTDMAAAEALVSQISDLHGVRTFTSNITLAPTASPYPFKAVLTEGGELSLSGGVPSFSARDTLLEQTGATDGGLEIMSGAPKNWSEAAGFAVSQLDGLTEGEVTLSDLSLSLSGTAKTPDSYIATNSGLMVELPNNISLDNSTIKPAFIDDYSFSATRADGVTLLSGFVPDETTRQNIADLTGVSTSNLKIASGAPENFNASLEYGLAYLGHMSNGQLDINNADLSVSGNASSASAFAMAGALGLPDGVNVTSAEITPITVTSYFWSAQKRADGSQTLRGYIPNSATRTALMARAGIGAIDHMQIASGAPETFYEDALVSLSALENLDTGRTGFSSNTWHLSGQPDTIASQNNASNALLTARTHTSQWRINLLEARPQIPYTWSAERFSNGNLVLVGYVANEATRAAIMARAGENSVDHMITANGAPITFYEDALVSLSALANLDTGRAGYTLDTWYLSGQPHTIANRISASDALATARTHADQWRVNLAEALPIVPYTWATEKYADSQLAITGYVPNEATRTAIMARAGENTIDHMITANGAPANFYEDALVGISTVKELSTGRAGHSASGWFLVGTPATQHDSETARNGLNTARTSANSWYVSLVEVPPVPVVPYKWSTQKIDDGSLIVAGNVPDEETRAALMVRAGEGAIDEMTISLGAPPHFYTDSLVAISALKELETGRAGHGGSGWFLFGSPANQQASDSAKGSLSTARTMSDNWYIALDPIAPEPAARIESLKFVAEFGLETSVLLSGEVPNNQIKTYLGLISDNASTVNLVKSAHTAPENFAINTRTGVRVLQTLIQGRMAYEGNEWSLIGKAQNPDIRSSAMAQIAALPDGAQWRTHITLPTWLDVCQEQIATYTGDKSIEFETASAVIVEDSMIILEELVIYLHQCRDANIHVEGHTDSQGDADYNQTLSEQRATAVTEALKGLGINGTRLTATGYGETLPIASNDTEEGRQQNRRMVFKIVE